MTPTRIAIVGPTFPYGGGIAAHTTTLANRLRAAGHEVALVSWRAQYPRFLRDAHILDSPEVVPFSPLSRPLAWYSPLGWLAVGRSLRRADIVVLTQVSSFHALPNRALRLGFGNRPHGIVLAHNVFPHESASFDRPLIRGMYRSIGRVVTHSDAQAELAHQLAGPSVAVTSLRMPLPDFVFPSEHNGLRQGSSDSKLRLVFFGTIRPYKGIDLLFEALARVPELSLVVAGEFMHGESSYRRQISALGLDARVELRSGYLNNAAIPSLLTEADALVLPYRGGSATFNTDLAFRFGLPVIATDAGTLARDVLHGVNGLVAHANDLDSLTAVLREAAEPGRLQALRASVDASQNDALWQRYCSELIAFAGL